MHNTRSTNQCRSLFASAVAMVMVSAPLAAQDLQRPDGWMTRFDNANATEDQLEMFVAMPPGWHVPSGPAAIYYAPDQTVDGDFRAEMEVYLFDPGERREAFGIFLGGSDLQGTGQEYSYFLIRNGGQYIVKRREGAEAPTVRPWTSHEAILSYADRGDEASIKNVLAVEARGDQVHLFVNGEEVATLPAVSSVSTGRTDSA